MASEEQDVAEPSENEAKARESGWAPKEEWKGKPEHWKSADEWLEQAPKNYIPKLEKKIGQLEGKLAKKEAETEDRIKRLEGTMKAHYQAQIDRIKDDYEAKKEKAVETGDTEGYRKAVADEKKAVESVAKRVEAAEEKQEKKDDKEIDLDGALKKLPEGEREVMREWLDENAWFLDNPRLNRHALAVEQDVNEEMPAASRKRKLAEVTSRMQERYPKEFGKAEDEEDEPRRGSRVESGSRNTNGGSKKKGWGDIDAEDRRLGESQIGEGKWQFKDKAAYAEAYWKSLEEDARA